MVALPPRLDVARLPTPVRPLTRLSEAWSGPKGPTLWVKHDDDTGGVLTGNKIRKLQYTVREAQAQGADTLVTCGGIQSNHCRATAALARRLGMEVTLCLRGQAPPRPEGNTLLDVVLGSDIRWWTPEQYADNASGMQAVAEQLRSRGRTPFVVAEGCSQPSGVWGYIEAAQEIAQAQREHSVSFDAVVHAVGSGGTSAGLELGMRLFGVSSEVIGVPVCDDAAYFRARVAALCQDTIRHYDLPPSAMPTDVDEDIAMLDGYVGEGYGRSRPEELQTLVQAARLEGVVLDPVYSGKAMHALRTELAHGRLAGMQHVLFVHTGGVFGLAPHAQALAEQD